VSQPGILFDVDGTLVDTTYLHTVAWWEALRQHDADVPMAEIHRSIGMGADHLVEHLLGPDRDEEQDEKMAAAHDILYAAWWERLRPLPGAAALLREAELRQLRRVIDADDVITAATSSSDAEQSKPAPDILAAALDQSGLDAGNTVFVGDSVWDVESAAKLDIPCIGLTCGGTSAAELRDAGAVATYPDPAALLADVVRGAAPIVRTHV
jgi:HAD superfamily hydrolase (TIGR01509 family)